MAPLPVPLGRLVTALVLLAPLVEQGVVVREALRGSGEKVPTKSLAPPWIGSVESPVVVGASRGCYGGGRDVWGY